MKKRVLSLLLGVVLLTACSNQTAQDAEDSQESVTSSSIGEEDTVIYTGTVKEVDAERLVILNMNSEEDVPGFDEVVLLMNNEIPVTNQSTGEAIQLSELKAEDQVEVTVKSPTPTTMSIPPQIPGNAIIQVSLVE